MRWRPRPLFIASLQVSDRDRHCYATRTVIWGTEDRATTAKSGTEFRAGPHSGEMEARDSQ
jgi:hypothetical protein